MYKAEDFLYSKLYQFYMYGYQNNPFAPLGKARRPKNLKSVNADGYMHTKEAYNHYMWLLPYDYKLASFVCPQGGGSLIDDEGAKCTIVRTIEAHAVFRQACFDYGIPLDYTDWTAEGFINKTLKDKTSWFYSFSLWVNEHATDSDFALFAWLMAAPVRRHPLLMSNRVKALPPEVLPMRSYRPYLGSPSSLVIDSNIDSM